MRRSLPAVGLAIVLELALAAPVAAIVYGTVDTQNRYANVGALILESDGVREVNCSGTLISPTIFLTAAHCARDGRRAWASFEVAIEEPVTNQTRTYAGTVRRHPSFACCGSNDTFDVAVVVLDRPVNGITPAGLPSANQLGTMSSQALNSATFVAAGYGTVRETRKGASQPLFWDPHRRYAEQTVLSLEPAWLNLSMNQATGDGGTCYGDSGGPHFLGTTVVSLTVTGDVWCKATDKTYRLDTPAARAFLDDFVRLP
jgi:secreted trypsin-like serine protease